MLYIGEVEVFQFFFNFKIHDNISEYFPKT
jgi:hypothetical protein